MARDSYAGKRLVVGLTYRDDKARLIGHVQYHGKILRINDDEGIVIKRMDGGGTFNLPPATELIQEADLDEYRLNSTGEIVRQPDYVLIMTITVPDKIAGAMRNGTKPIEPEHMRSWTQKPPPDWGKQ